MINTSPENLACIMPLSLLLEKKNEALLIGKPIDESLEKKNSST